MLVQKRFVLLFGLIACQSKKAPDDVSSHVVPLITEDASPAPVIDTGVVPGPCADQAEPIELDKAPCNLNADCVLTDVAAQCNACNTKSLYPALKKQVDLRDMRCGGNACVPRKCPPHDTYSPAFYRAECRAGRCVSFRWHSGG